MRKIVSVMLIVVMIICMFSGSITVQADAINSKISDDLRQTFSTLSTSETTTAWVTMEDVDHDAVMKAFSERYPIEYAAYINAKYDSTYDAPLVAVPQDDLENIDSTMFSAKAANTVDGEVLQRAIEYKRSIYKEFYSEANSETISQYFSADKTMFISTYAPVAVVETTATDTRRMAWNNNVISISPYTELLAVEHSLSLANQITRADYVRDTFGNTGTGVKIGMIEAEGIPNVNDTYLKSASIYTRSGNTTIADHATKVARILVGTDTTGANDGLAPNSQLYCCTGKQQSTFISGVEWLLDYGVNIINISMGFYVNTGLYDSLSAWLDHVAVQHDVHVVAAAGNENGYITSPAMAYNAITVGGLSTNGSDAVSGFELYNKTNYQEADTELETVFRPEKPNLVAPIITTWGLNTGTSFAAPQVAGTIAQMSSMNSALKVKQAAVGAILAASSAEKVDAVGSGATGDTFMPSVRINSQISNKEGAGILDARWARGIVYYNTFHSYTIEKSSLPFEQDVWVDASTNSLTRVAIFWLKRNTVSNHNSETVAETPISDLDIWLYDPNGNLVGSSETAYSNFEIIQFIPRITGTYTLRINGASTEKDHVGIAVW